MPDTTIDPGIDLGYGPVGQPPAPAPATPTTSPTSAALPFFGGGQQAAPQQGGSSFPVSASPYQQPQPGQDADISGIKDLLGVLDPNDPRDKAFQDNLQKTFAYTPEKRAHDMYDQMFGITRTPVKDNTGAPVLDANGQPTQDVHHNWGKFMLGMVGEALRGASEKGNYVPPMERFRQQALSQFQAEAVPLAKELQYRTQEQRSAMSVARQYFSTLEQAQTQGAKTRVAQQKANTQDYIARTVGLPDARKQELIERAKNESTEEGLNNIRAQAVQEGINLTKSREALTWQQEINAAQTQGQSGDDAFAVRQARLRASGDPRDKQLADLETQARAAEYQQKNPGTFEKDSSGNAYNKKYNYTTTGDTGVPGTAPGGNSQNTLPLPDLNKIYPNGPPLPPGETPQNTVNNTVTQPKIIKGMPVNPALAPEPVGLPLDQIHSPQDMYSGRGRVPKMQGSQISLPNTPPGRDFTNDAVQYLPHGSSKASAGDQKLIDSGPALYINSQHALKVLNDPSLQNEIGAISGNWNQFIQGHAPVPPKLRELQTSLLALSAAHLGAQGSRAGQAAENLEKMIYTPGSSKEDIAGAIKGLTNQIKSVYVDHPEGKDKLATAIVQDGGDYYDMEKITDEPQYIRDKQMRAQQLAGKAQPNVNRTFSGEPSSTNGAYLNSITK